MAEDHTWAAGARAWGDLLVARLDWVNCVVLVVVFSLSALVLNFALHQSRLVHAGYRFGA